MSSAHDPTRYVGRFAPSPTGDLHFGSLVAAVASFIEARAHGGAWRVRIEDLDPPREVPGAAGSILADLERFGMAPDGNVLYQSSRKQAYAECVDELLARGLAYWCGCSRQELAPDGVYPGTCAQGLPRGRKPRAVRLRVPDRPIRFTDRIQGEVECDLRVACGDFVIHRADGLPAYQLAVVVDDAYQNVTEVVRGADLLDSTPRQIHLQHCLGLPTPRYAHVPVVLGTDGKKLSKRSKSDPVRSREAAAAIRAALAFLGHDAPAMDLSGTWQWARRHWDLGRVPRQAGARLLPGQ